MSTSILSAPGTRPAASLLVRTPRAARIVGRLLAVSVLAVALGLLLPWQQSVSGEGRVVAFAPLERQQELDAPIEGRITRWYVGEGSKVEKDELLLELTDNDPSILTRLREERAAVVARRDAVLAGSTPSWRGRSRSSRPGVCHSRGREPGHDGQGPHQGGPAGGRRPRRPRCSPRSLNLERQAKLLEQGLTSQRNLELAQLESVRTATESERSQASLSAALGEASALESDRMRVEHDLSASLDDARASEASALADEANAAAELARLEVRLARQNTMELRAPAGGTVLRLRVGPGQRLREGRRGGCSPSCPTPKSARWSCGSTATTCRCSRTADRCACSSKAGPRCSSPAGPRSPSAPSAARWPLIDATDDGTGRFRILVRPDGQQAWPTGLYLRQGVRVNGWVLLEPGDGSATSCGAASTASRPSWRPASRPPARRGRAT